MRQPDAIFSTAVSPFQGQGGNAHPERLDRARRQQVCLSSTSLSMLVMRPMALHEVKGRLPEGMMVDRKPKNQQDVDQTESRAATREPHSI